MKKNTYTGTRNCLLTVTYGNEKISRNLTVTIPPTIFTTIGGKSVTIASYLHDMRAIAINGIGSCPPGTHIAMTVEEAEWYYYNVGKWTHGENEGMTWAGAMINNGNPLSAKAYYWGKYWSGGTMGVQNTWFTNVDNNYLYNGRCVAD
jgi:hypothetical protein